MAESSNNNGRPEEVPHRVDRLTDARLHLLQICSNVDGKVFGKRGILRHMNVVLWLVKRLLNAVLRVERDSS